ncbi:MAG: nickel/cobalt transporter [Chloroflexota bacterium]
MRNCALAALVAVGLLAVAPDEIAAHPLGNFTINHYAGLTVGTDGIAIRYVLDMAEIPAFSALDELDTDDDGTVTDAEREQYAEALGREIVDGLQLELNGSVAPLEVVEHRIEFPPGQGGLDTLRLTLEMRADHPVRAEGPVDGSFSDEAFSERLGWREIVVSSTPDARLLAATVPESSVSDELRSYPEDSLDSPLDVREASFSYQVIDGRSGATPGSSTDLDSPSVDGPRADPFGSLLATEGNPFAALLAVMVSIGLGAAHALSPGHGKTLVAAYVIGARGSLRQAAWLGLIVAVTHTIGIFVLGATVLGASELIVPERVIELLSVATAALVTALGVWLVMRALASFDPASNVHRHRNHEHHDAHGHHEHDAYGRHLPASGKPSVALIGLAGGLVPSASALIVLLVAVNQGRLGFGILLLAAFGIGMALVLGGIGAAVVLFRARLDAGGSRWMRHRLVRRLSELLPLVSALAVIAIGVVLSVQALLRLS